VKVLVTGATGFVARHLVPALAVEHEVFALGHDADRIVSGENIKPVVVDLRNARDAEFPAVEAIVHLAQANVPFPDGALDLHAVNAAATVALLDHARRCNASHFVYASSASVYGMGDRPWTEEDEPAATDFYSATKLAGERFVGAYAGVLSTICMRLVAPYGPGQRNRMIPRLIDSVREGRPITLNAEGRPRMNPIYVADVVGVVQAALAIDGSHVVNVAGDDTASIRELGESIGRAIGQEPLFEEGDNPAAGDIVCANDRMRAVFAVESLISLDDWLRRTAEELAAT
jgi:UDP-glucose 4-epimerase